MSKPTTSLDWAERLEAETIQSQEGESVLVFNKVEPSVAFKESGFRARSRLVRAYLNYHLYSLSQYIKYLIIGEVGDVKLLPTTTTVAEVEARFGGTWADRGTQSLGSITKRVFERTA